MASRVLHEKMTFEPRFDSDEGINLVFIVSKTGKENQQIGSRMEGEVGAGEKGQKAGR